MKGDRARPPLAILTSLRFFIAADVVVYHEVAPHLENEFLRGLAAAGYQAVTFFFVLSGFILTYVYANDSEKGNLTGSVKEFWRARIARILPAYLLGLAIAFPHFLYSAFVSHIVTIHNFVVGLVLVPIAQQAWWPPAAMAWNAPAWSLSVEFLFYLCFPALMFGAACLPRNTFVILAYAFVVAMVFIRFVISSPDSTFDSFAWNFEKFFPLFHLAQFIFGMALGRLYFFGPTLPSRIHALMLVAGIIAVLVILGARVWLPPWVQTDAILVLVFGLIIFGAAGAQEAAGVLTLPALTLLGEASYSLYILHMPLGWWWAWLTRGMVLPAIPGFAAYFVSAVLISILSYRYVENPLRRWILGHRAHRAA